MATLVLVRHGRTTANASGVLAGRTPGVTLDETGLDQARRAAERVAAVELAGVVSSPLERCRETAQTLMDRQSSTPPLSIENGIIECDYGDWQGRSLADLAKEDLWATVQNQPSAVTFPGGESMPTMQARAVAAVRENDAAFEAEHGPSAVWAAVSHGDIIKSVLADALGMHLDLFQRIVVDPCSVSVVRYTDARPYVLRANDTGGDLAAFAPPKKKGRARKKAADDATVGGGAGAGAV